MVAVLPQYRASYVDVDHAGPTAFTSSAELDAFVSQLDAACHAPTSSNMALFAQAGYGTVHTLHAGQSIVIPKGCHHAAVNILPSISINSSLVPLKSAIRVLLDTFSYVKRSLLSSQEDLETLGSGFRKLLQDVVALEAKLLLESVPSSRYMGGQYVTYITRVGRLAHLGCYILQSVHFGHRLESGMTAEWRLKMKARIDAIVMRMLDALPLD